jgi:pimeloyl-ACP methyl ester carboxylesterase
LGEEVQDDGRVKPDGEAADGSAEGASPDDGAANAGVVDSANPHPVAVEFRLDQAVARGHRWGDAPAILLLHAPGPDRDLDDWRDLPALLAAETGAGLLALDLPGHGLSDDGGAADDPAALLAAIRSASDGRSLRAVVAAGETAGALLAAGPDLDLDGLVCFSPAGAAVADPVALPRSPRLPKLLLARSGGNSAEVRHARALSRAVGGWAVVVGVAADGPGAALLDGPSGGPVRDHVAGFLRECLTRGG